MTPRIRLTAINLTPEVSPGPVSTGPGEQGGLPTTIPPA